jgi:hypothetical protein
MAPHRGDLDRSNRYRLVSCIAQRGARRHSPGDDRGGCRDHYDDNGGDNDNNIDHNSAAVDTRSRNNGL